jgi:predicted HicB family RNase H-like nuclease
MNLSLSIMAAKEKKARANKNKMGRPRIDPRKRMSKQISIRVTRDVWDILQHETAYIRAAFVSLSELIEGKKVEVTFTKRGRK